MADMSLNVGIKGFKQGTNIKDVKVPAALRERRMTGITWFDDALGGEGMVPSSTFMVTGAPAAGKSTLIRQLADTITGQGHIAIMNSGEESLYQVSMACERLNLKNGFMAGQEIMTAGLLTYADNVRKANPKKQVFILQDSLQTLNDGKYKDGGTTGNTPVRCCEQLTNWAKSTYGIVLFVGQVTKGGDFAGKNTIKHMIDGHTELYFDTDKKSETFGERLFEVTKNRFGCSGKTFVIGMEKTGLYEKGCFSKVGN